MDNTSKKRGRKPSRARDNAIDLDDEPFSNDHYVILFALWLLHIKFRALIAPPSPEVRSAPTHQLAIKLDGLTFDSLRTVKARIARLPPGPDRVDAWVEVVRQLNRRYRRGTDIDFDVISTIKADPSWGLCKWSVENVNKLVEPIQVHVIAVKNTSPSSNRDYCHHHSRIGGSSWRLHCLSILFRKHSKAYSNDCSLG